MTIPWKALLTVAGLALAIGGLAFHEHKPEGARFFPEDTEEQLQRQQVFSGRLDEVVGVARADDTPHERAPIESEPDSTVAQASRFVDGRQALVEAERRTQEKSKPRKPLWMVGLLMAGLGFGIVLGVRRWVDRHAPPPPPSRKVSW